MDLLSRISDNDWFNYYIAGCAWSLAFLLTPLLGVRVSTLLENLPTAGQVFLLGIVPYLLGLILTPFSEKIAGICRPDFLANALSSKGKRSLVRKLREQAINNATTVFGQEIQNQPLYFYWMQAYVWQYPKNGAVVLARRAKSMRNLYESLLLPATLVGGLSIYRAGHVLQWVGCLSWISAVIFSALLVCILFGKYHRMYENYVKHVVRAFLVITNHELSKGTLPSSHQIGGDEIY